MDRYEQALARARHDAQAEHTKRLCALLADAEREVDLLRRMCMQVPVETDQQQLVLDLLAALGESKRIERPQGRLHGLLGAAQEQAVHLARAHGATWTAIGEALGEARTNVRTRYAATSSV